MPLRKINVLITFGRRLDAVRPRIPFAFEIDDGVATEQLLQAAQQNRLVSEDAIISLVQYCRLHPPAPFANLDDLQIEAILQRGASSLVPVSPLLSIGHHLAEESSLESIHFVMIVSPNAHSPRFQLFEEDDLRTLRSHYWNKPIIEEQKTIFQSSPELLGEVDDKMMPGPISVSYIRMPDVNDTQDNKLLVREEYKKAYLWLESLVDVGRRLGGALLSGSPGIGKTKFLIYCLIRRLSEGKPTFFSLRCNEIMYYFDEHGVSSVELSQTRADGMSQKGPWVIIEPGEGEDKETTGPCSVFTYSLGSFLPAPFLVQTSTLDTREHRRWVERNLGIPYCMDPWTWDELLAWSYIRSLKPNEARPGAKRLRELVHRFGTSPQVVYSTPSDADKYAAALEDAIEASTIPTLNRLLGTSWKYWDGDLNLARMFSALFVTRSVEDASMDVYRRYGTHVDFASPYIYERLKEKFAGEKNDFEEFVSTLPRTGQAV